MIEHYLVPFYLKKNYNFRDSLLLTFNIEDKITLHDQAKPETAHGKSVALDV